LKKNQFFIEKIGFGGKFKKEKRNNWKKGETT
jgi:hypothetical protein